MESHVQRRRLAVAAVTFILLKCLRKKSQKRKRRFWVKQIYKNRLESGNQLYAELVSDKVEHNFARMNANQFEILCSLLNNKLRKNDTNYRDAITVKERLLLTLRFLATGDSYVSLQYLFRISKQSISKIIPEVCEAIIDLLNDYVKVPSTEEEWRTVSQQFENKWNFPHVIGAMDGKHVAIQSPFNSGNDFDNYKLFPSIVLFALVDANYRFLYVNVGTKGRISDGGVFKSTNLYKKLEKKELNIPPPEILQVPYKIEVPYYILGDKAFQLNDYTMKPYDGTRERGSCERIFNYRLSRARRVVENAFGVLSSVYRVLRKPMLLEPETATKVVLATVHLYNYLRSNPNFISPGTFDTVQENGDVIPGSWRNEPPSQSLQPMAVVPRRATENATTLRSHLARHFVTNHTIVWQNEYQ
ncbi:uncharacterized protein LOC128683450 [Plodia interpunctella]|uniref:uncharacterized protein LOC128678580 n=1 Tax=Plodia interpunctella TaxID=58824 RepID=UPI002367B4A4|nr:uncharacterized protein LOC128677776 [Plodia interpunctella]XP_053615431.1 uncharacterized protein LOC128678123 isoform X1 [Plodia interpunctella]XP_053616171.1 uncharacterized protein LOC128678580 [Plodia interpunctella]XP_053622491.1 uncharacterized protein LOC128682044 [Plodia interpunctella]XP_053625093.1 uncharacterized protein LOC128683450 [Plodia interpunctella]